MRNISKRLQVLLSFVSLVCQYLIRPTTSTLLEIPNNDVMHTQAQLEIP